MQTLILAHRGAALNGPENTLAAFRLAFENGAAGVECDLRVAKDGEIILFHDKNAKRLTGFNLEIEQCKWIELKELRVLGKEPITHIDDFLNLLAAYPGKFCYFEAGKDGFAGAERLIEKLKKAGLCSRSFLLAFSNKKEILLRAKKISEEIRTSIMPIVPVNIVATAKSGRADSICAGWIDWPFAREFFLASAKLFNFAGQVRKARRLGIQTTGGIANTPEEVRIFLNYGVDGVWTDDVPMAVKTVKSEGLCQN